MYGKIELWQEIWVGRPPGAIPGTIPGWGVHLPNSGDPFTKMGGPYTASLYEQLYRKKLSPPKTNKMIRFARYEPNIRKTKRITIDDLMNVGLTQANLLLLTKEKKTSLLWSVTVMFNSQHSIVLFFATPFDHWRIEES